MRKLFTLQKLDIISEIFTVILLMAGNVADHFFKGNRSGNQNNPSLNLILSFLKNGTFLFVPLVCNYREKAGGVGCPPP